MLRIRLQRRGKKNYATFRVVVAQQSAPIKGKYIADLGWYNPHTNEFTINKEDALDWITKGAQATPTVHNLLVEHGYLKAEKVTSWAPKKKEGEEDTAAKKDEPSNTKQPAKDTPQEDQKDA